MIKCVQLYSSYLGLFISQIFFRKLIINYYLVIYKKVVHKYDNYYLVVFGSLFITVPSTRQGDFQYSPSLISSELIRNSHAMLAAHPDKKLIAIKLINIKIYFIPYYRPKNSISLINLFI